MANVTGFLTKDSVKEMLSEKDFETLINKGKALLPDGTKLKVENELIEADIPRKSITAAEKAGYQKVLIPGKADNRKARRAYISGKRKP